MQKSFLNLIVLSLLVLPLSAGAMYNPDAEVSDTDGMQNRAMIQMTAGDAEPMLLVEGSEANESASETAMGRVQENWQNRVEKLKAQRETRQTKKADKEQYRAQVRTEFQQFQGEMKDAVQERYENWQNTLDKKFDKWEARVEKAKDGDNSEEVMFLQTEIKRFKEDLQAQFASVEASRQAIEVLRADQDLWVAEHQAEWQMHKDNLKALRDNMSALNSYLRQLKDLLQ